MTTVTYRSGVIASDSLVSNEEYLMKTFSRKIFKVDGVLIGVCGGSYSGLVFVDWFRGLLLDDCMWDLDVGDDFEALVVHPDGEILTYNRYLIPDEHGKPKFFAVGSGSKCAYIALEMGASAERAVKLACKYDLYSGGDIQVLGFNDKDLVAKKSKALISIKRKR